MKLVKFFIVIFSIGFIINGVKAQRFVLVDVNKVLDNIDEYQAEQVLLTEEQRKGKEEEIMNREKEARKMQKDKFGEEGELFKKRQDLVRPVQDKVYAAIQEYAISKGLEVIFDTSGSAGVIYYSKELDKTDDIIKKFKPTGK